jgi:hypothetical protein
MADRDSRKHSRKRVPTAPARRPVTTA